MRSRPYLKLSWIVAFVFASIVAVTGVSALRVAQVLANAIPTTMSFETVGGSDPEGGSYGQIMPHAFMLTDIPYSYALEAHGVQWGGWGAPTAQGHGRGVFHVIMTGSENVSFTITLSRRRLIRCARATHFAYTRLRLDISEFNGVRPEIINDVSHPGCTKRLTGSL